MNKIYSWLSRLVIAACMIAIPAMIAAQETEQPFELLCEGQGISSTGEDAGPVNYLRLRVSVDRRVLKDRHLSFDRFRGGFKSGEPQFIFEPIAHLGEVWISYCNQPDWPDGCTRQRPAQRDLMVAQVSQAGDPVFLSGYAGCSFCPLAPLHVFADDDDRIRFRYVDFDSVEGFCRSE